MKQKISLFILFIGLNFYAQTTFEKGYVISKNQEKKEVYIKAFGELIPDKITYKTNENSTKLYTLLSDEINELFIESKVKFIRKNVKFEKLLKGMKSTSTNNSKNFKLIEQNLLLRVLLVFDDKKLLTYQDENNNNYFFIEDANSINLLEYKVFKKNNKNIIVKSFRNYLFKNYKPTVKVRLKYKESSIKNYLIFYSRDNNLTFTEYNGVFRELKDALNITPKIGYAFVNHQTKSDNSSFDSEVNSGALNVGLDFEYFFNTSLKKSSLVVSFQYLFNVNGEEDFAFGSGNTNNSRVNSDFTMINAELKYRHYFPLKNGQFLFMNVGTGVQKSSGNIVYTFNQNNTTIADLDFNNTENKIYYTVGLGYNYNKIHVNFDYNIGMNGVFDSNNTNATLANFYYERNMIILSLGYTLF